MPDDEIFNIFKACEALKINKEIYLRILSKAIDQTKNDIEQLKQAHQSNDISTVQAIAHRLKGDYANLRIEKLSEIAARLNFLARGEKYNSEQAAMFINEFDSVFQGIKEQFSESS